MELDFIAGVAADPCPPPPKPAPPSSFVVARPQRPLTARTVRPDYQQQHFFPAHHIENKTDSLQIMSTAAACYQRPFPTGSSSSSFGVVEHPGQLSSYRSIGGVHVARTTTSTAPAAGGTPTVIPPTVVSIGNSGARAISPVRDPTMLLRPKRPLTAGNRIANTVREMKTEMYLQLPAAPSNPNTGPQCYANTDAAWLKLQPNSPRCCFSTSSRLQILPADIPTSLINSLGLTSKTPRTITTAASSSAVAAAAANAATSPKRKKKKSVAAADTEAAAKSPLRRSPSPPLIRSLHIAGKGHWLDGMATGSSICGVYNRFSQAGPGAGRYDVRGCKEYIRPASTRCVFGTSPRFHWQKPVKAPQGPSSSSSSPRGTQPAAAGEKATGNKSTKMELGVPPKAAPTSPR